MDWTPNRQLGLSEWQRIAVLKGAKAVSDLQGATPATPTTNEWGPFVRVHEEADRLSLGGIYVILPICYVAFLKDIVPTVGIRDLPCNRLLPVAEHLHCEMVASTTQWHQRIRLYSTRLRFGQMMGPLRNHPLEASRI